MDLTLASAVSADSLLGHMAYIVLIVSMLMRVMTWLRILVIVSAILAISYGAFILRDPVTVFWETLLVAVNVYQLFRLHWRNLRARFSPEERSLFSRHFFGLSAGETRWFLDKGDWRDIPADTVLTEQGKPVSHLTYVASGLAEVRVHDVPVSVVEPGNFVGEMTAPEALPATATVRAKIALRVWQIEAATLRDMIKSDSDFARELEAAFAREFRAKLIASNEHAATVRGGATKFSPMS